MKYIYKNIPLLLFTCFCLLQLIEKAEARDKERQKEDARKVGLVLFDSFLFFFPFIVGLCKVKQIAKIRDNFESRIFWEKIVPK